MAHTAAPNYSSSGFIQYATQWVWSQKSEVSGIILLKVDKINHFCSTNMGRFILMFL